MPEQVMDDEVAEEVMVIACDICGLSSATELPGSWTPHDTLRHPCGVCGGRGHDVSEHDYCAACQDYVAGAHEGVCGACECHYSDCSCEDEDEDEDPEDGVNIHDYSWQPSTILYNGMVGGEPVTLMGPAGIGAHHYPAPPDNQPYLGLEVECEGVEGSPSEIARAWNEYSIGWSKTDGSLRRGVECVTHPVTYERLEHDGLLVKAIQAMRRAGGRAWEPGNCGLHIHISRPSFASKSHQWRFAAAHEAMSAELRTMSGRLASDSYDGGEGYCKWSGSLARELRDRQGNSVIIEATLRRQEREEIASMSRHYATYEEQEAADEESRRVRRLTRRSWVDVPQKATRIISGKQTVSDRYVSVNVTEGTIELRFWRGSMATKHVMGAAAMVDALHQWTRDMSVQDVRATITRKSAATKNGSLAWRSFTKWASENLPAHQCGRIVTLATGRKVPVPASLVRAAHAAEGGES